MPNEAMTGSPAMTLVERGAIPYIPFDTFKNFIEGLAGGRPLPPRVDRSLMIGMAGGTQTLLLGTLTTFGLIGENREVTPSFIELVRAGEDERPLVMERLLRDLYPQQLDLGARQGTADQLAESFRELSGYQGSTLRKAITFFLNMAKYASVPLSPFFRPPVQAGSGKGKGVRRSRAAVAGPPMPVAVGIPGTAAESQTVSLRSGGTVTVSCSASFLSLTKEDRAFVFDLVDRLLEYSALTPPGAAGDRQTSTPTAAGEPV